MVVFSHHSSAFTLVQGVQNGFLAAHRKIRPMETKNNEKLKIRDNNNNKENCYIMLVGTERPEGHLGKVLVGRKQVTALLSDQYQQESFSCGCPGELCSPMPW